MTIISDTPTARRSRHLASVLLGSTAMIGLAMTSAARADETWTGTASSDWFDASNWSPATVPTAAVGVIVDRGGGVGTGMPSGIDGNSASAATVTIGLDSMGLLDVDTSGSLTTIGNITLGVNAGSYGSLTAYDAGTVTSSGSLVIGALGTGDAIFEDAGTQATFSHDVEVGGNNTGSLSIQSGATLMDKDGYIGVSQDVSGTVTVDGSGSVWNNSAGLFVGYAGKGALTVSGGGKVADTDAEIGYQPTATGLVTVEDAGSTWTSSGSLFVGHGGAGELDVENGGQVKVGGATTIGANAGYTGIVGVYGAGSNLTVGGMLTVGNLGGNGSLTIEGKGEVDAAGVTIGGSAGSVGYITVDDAALGASTGPVVIGLDGTGTIKLEDGGALHAQSLDLGVNASSSGNLNIADAASQAFVTQGIVVGDAGTGSLFVQGILQTGEATIGAQSGSTGTVTVEGQGAWAVQNDFLIGEDNDASGALTVAQAGQVYVTGTMKLGVYADSTGNATVTDADSALKIKDNLLVGEGGDGELTIKNGGVVTAEALTFVGQDYGSTGFLTVDGSGSAFNAIGNIFVGGDGVDPTGGTGTVAVGNGGAVDASGAFDIGVAADASATVTVDGSGSKITAALIAAGAYGSGMLNIKDGGAVIAPVLAIGETATATGTVSVSGPASSFFATGVVTVGDYGFGTLTISDGGLVTAASGLRIAVNAGSTGELTIGGEVGQQAEAPGTLSAPAVVFGAGTGNLNFNHTAGNYSFASTIIGAGTINQIAGTTILTADSSSFTGPTSVTGGRLAVNGSLSNSIVTVSDGGILGGNGTVGGIVAGSGGIVGPGNSIGTLNVAGDVKQASGSTYQVELSSAGQSDLIHATGTAMIAPGADLNVTKKDAAPYVVGTQYTVLQADGGVSGTYTVTNDNVSAFIGLVENEDPTHVYLDVEKTKSFASVGSTANQKATGGGVDSIGGGPVQNAILSIPTESQAQDAFDQLSGEIHASAKGIMIDDSRFARDAALDRLRDAFDAVGAVGTPVLAYADGETTQAIADTDSFAMWGRGFGAWGLHEGDGNAATIKRDIGGLFTGGDGLITDTIRLGVLGGYSHSTFQVADRNSSGSSDNYHLGLYGGTRWGNLAFRSGAVYTWQDISTDRSVAFPGFTDALKANYSARTAQVFGEFGYRVDAGRTAAGKLAFEPFADLAYVNLATDDFSEAGGAAALTSQADTTGVTFGTLGLRGSTDIALGNGATVSARGMLGWRHAYGDTTPLSTMAFAGGLPFTIAGVPIARDAAVVEAGLDISLSPGATFAIAYDGQFGSGIADQSVKGTLDVKF